MIGIKGLFHSEVKSMPKYCYNYDSGDYEYIDKDGYSWDRNEYVYNWDDSEYRREEEYDDDEDDL